MCLRASLPAPLEHRREGLHVAPLAVGGAGRRPPGPLQPAPGGLNPPGAVVQEGQPGVGGGEVGIDGRDPA